MSASNWAASRTTPRAQHPLQRRRERLELDQAARPQLVGTRAPGMEGAPADAVMEGDHVTRDGQIAHVDHKAPFDLLVNRSGFEYRTVVVDCGVELQGVRAQSTT
jgi:hypothetical protein